MWVLKCYTTTRGDNEIREWYDSLAEKDKTKVHLKIDYLQNVPKVKWSDPYAHLLTNSDGLYSIRLPLKNNQHRIVGYFREEKNEFIIDFFRNSTALANLLVAVLLESACTSLYTCVSAMLASRTLLTAASCERSLMLLCFLEKSTKADYKKVIEKGNLRKKEVLSDETRIIEYNFSQA